MTGLTQIEKVKHLRRVDLFSHCSAEQIIRIAAIAGERMFLFLRWDKIVQHFDRLIEERGAALVYYTD